MLLLQRIFWTDLSTTVRFYRTTYKQLCTQYNVHTRKRRAIRGGKGVQETDRTAYLSICMKYRVISIALCTLAYLSPVTNAVDLIIAKLWIVFGMLAACFLGIYLYQKTLAQHGQELLTHIVLGLELFAYGIFTFLSGGFASPYLWYYISCLFIMMALQRNILFTILGTAWCLLCAIVSRLIGPHGMPFTYLELNLIIGTVVIIGDFYILLHYIHRLVHHQEQQKLLNLRLEQEKERTEQALKQITNLYDTLNLFAMTDPHQVMEDLGLVLKRTVAPGGCILAKLNINGTVEEQEVCGVDEESATEAIAAALEQWNTEQMSMDDTIWEEIDEPTCETKYEGMRIGRGSSIQGVFLRRKVEISKQEKKQDSFYRGLIEIIFRNLDTQKQLEEYIITEEQNRLANEIHDTVIQKLFGLVCSLKILETSLEELDTDVMRKKLQILKRSAELTMAELRDTIYGRRFEGCNGDVFISKLRLYMEEMERLSGATIEMNIDDNVGIMTAAQKITIYRIACEAVNNAVQHGKAQRVTVRLRLAESSIQAEIEDNGTGLVKVQTAPLYGNGLRNMQRMVSLLKGQFILEPGKRCGVKIKLSLPR